MRYEYLFRIFLLLFTSIRGGVLHAQRILPLQHISVEEGLSQSTVYSILQDRQGFIWFATGDGINRYDGRTFIPYKTRFNDSLSRYPKDRNVNSLLFEDKFANIWFTSDAGLSYLDARHRSARLVHNNFVVGNGILFAIADDSVWIAAHDRGLNVFALNGKGFRQYRYRKNEDSSHNIVVGAVMAGRSVWIADHEGLLYFDKATRSFQRKFRSGAITGLYRLADGNLLLGTLNGLYKYELTSGKVDFLPLRYDDKDMQWSDMAEDTITHNLYVSALGAGTLCKFSLVSGDKEFFDFQGSSINSLFIDRSMNLWIGTDGAGVYKLDIKPHKFYCYPVDRPYNAPIENGLMVKSIYRDGKGRFWIGSYYKGLLIYDPSTRELEKVDIPGYDHATQPVTVVSKDHSGSMLVAFNNNLAWIDPSTLKLRRHLQLEDFSGSSQVPVMVSSVVEWSPGKYLVGTNQGVYVLADDGDKHYLGKPYAFLHHQYTSSWNYSLYTAGDSIVYLGTRNGMAKIKMTGDTTFKFMYGSFDSVPVRGFYRSSSTSILWIASELGLIAYNESTKKYRVFDERSGMANSFVYAILPQADTMLWLSTNGGITNLKLSLSGDSILKTHFDNYTAKDGLQSDEFNTGAYYRSPDGIMAFGGINGINWFDPALIKPNPYKAIPAIASIEVNDTLYASDTAGFIRSLALPYSGNTISFSLRALEYTNPARNRFAYKLEGLDKDWVYTTNDKVRYADLKPGQYHFLLKVSNNEGLWNDRPLSVRLVIQPPFWETWWFRVLVLLVLLLSAYLVARYYIRQKVKERTLELEKQQALYLERMRISKDVHDDLGSGLSKITLMAELAGKQKNGEHSLDETIDDISQISRDLVGNMRDLVWVLNPENTTLDSLVVRLREYCSDYFEGLPMQLQLDFPSSVPAFRVLREAQRNIFLTVKEALNNAVKHAEATVISVQLSLDDGMLHISVSDNGSGFKPELAGRGGNGLKNMKQRIEVIGGDFEIISRPGCTIAKMSVPLQKIEAGEITP